jgi:hypothetical protein
MHLDHAELSASLDGALTGGRLEHVVRHLSVCRECRDAQARLARQDDALRRLLAQEPGAEQLDRLSSHTAAVIEAIATGAPVPQPATDATREGETVLTNGWGRVGARPAAAAVPVSDPLEVQRLLELHTGTDGRFVELGATTPQPTGQEPVTLPAWMNPTVSTPTAPAPAPVAAVPAVPVLAAPAGPAVATPSAPGARVPLAWATGGQDTAPLAPSAHTRPLTQPLHADPRRSESRRRRHARRSTVTVLVSGTAAAAAIALAIWILPPRTPHAVTHRPAIEILPGRDLGTDATQPTDRVQTTSRGDVSVPIAQELPPTVAPDAQETTPTVNADAEPTQWPTVCGVVLDRDGQPILGATVTVSSQMFSVPTDARGHFCIALPPGTHTLLVQARGHASQRVETRFATGASDLRLTLADAR